MTILCKKLESFGVVVTASSVYGLLVVLYVVEFCNGNLELYLSGCSTELGCFYFGVPWLWGKD
ncbi:hypothetical protein H5410_038368 [Solanum commersonii]|uniref:Uncharacterized protein n=1 Tax=Solanum commersonii TaxID=4109 RepID=A0A9J5YC44_SOLCO|nr:hypothetical protein H5410_038368 [Solanum commersonii]